MHHRPDGSELTDSRVTTRLGEDLPQGEGSPTPLLPSKPTHRNVPCRRVPHHRMYQQLPSPEKPVLPHPQMTRTAV